MSNRFIDNVTPLNAATLNQLEADIKNDTAKLGATMTLTGETLQLKNLDGTNISSVTLPVASQTTRGGIKIWVTGTTLNISTT